MESEVDDIFKSFVNSKLKQLGMHGSSTVELEKSIQQSVLGKLGAKSSDNNNEVDDEIEKKSKKTKKRKKEKKEKKEKRHKKEKLDNENISVVSRKSDDAKRKTSLTRKVAFEEDDSNIENKTHISFHTTTNKIKEIENLAIKVELPEKTALKSFKENYLPSITTSTTDVISSSLSCNSISTVETSADASAASPSSKPSLATSINVDNNSVKQELHICQESKTQVFNTANSTTGPRSKSSVETTPSSSCNTEMNETVDSKMSSDKKRDRSPSKKRSKHSHRSRSPKHRHHHHHHHHRHHHRSRSNEKRHRRSHRSRSLSPIITSQDKMKLLEIAKANVFAQHKAGAAVSNLSHESKALLCSGGVTLQQLTGVCKDIAEGKRELVAPCTSNEVSSAKVHHPFQVREAPMISINIKNALPPPPTKPISELTKEYPVSCGSQHQRKEVFEDVYGKWEPIEKDKSTSVEKELKVFPDVVDPSVTSIKEVIAQRVSAVRELQSNPDDANALKSMLESQEKLDNWTASKILPGRFTGSTSLQPLDRKQLERGGHQAWANQNSLNSGKKVDGIGKSLLQKMGWKEGDSLGKSQVGMVEPIKVQVKTDRKGLSSVMEMPASLPIKPRKGGNMTTLKDFSGKHPVSAIMEICSKRRWNAPEFVLVGNNGPDHHRSFMFKVMVNGVFYQPSIPSANKKQAKVQAATAALQALGLIPS